MLRADLARVPSESVVALFQLLEERGLRAAAASLPLEGLAHAVRGPLTRENWRVWEALHADSYQAVLERAADGAGVEPDLVQALARQESHFEPRARSSVGASGLMQLMPGTAAGVARAIGVSAPGEDALLDPIVNARLGSLYLAQLGRRFRGAWPLAVASYNAGPGRVMGWRAQRAQMEVDEWVEEIPLEETREYVKKVMGGFATYQLLRQRDAGVRTARR